VGALLSFPMVVAAAGASVPLLVPSTGRFGLASASDVKDQIVGEKFIGKIEIHRMIIVCFELFDKILSRN